MDSSDVKDDAESEESESESEPVPLKNREAICCVFVSNPQRKVNNPQSTLALVSRVARLIHPLLLSFSFNLFLLNILYSLINIAVGIMSKIVWLQSPDLIWLVMHLCLVR